MRLSSSNIFFYFFIHSVTFKLLNNYKIYEADTKMTRDWRDYLIKHNAEIIDKLPHWLNIDYISTCIPILSTTPDATVNNPKHFITGTAFLYEHKGWLFIVTALHCIYDMENHYAKSIYLGFQGINSAAERYIASQDLMHEIASSSWVWSYDDDIAILPIKMDPKFKQQISIHYFDNSNIVDKTNLSRKNEGIHLGYGHGKSLKSKLVDRKKGREEGLSEEKMIQMEKEGFPVWLPWGSLARIMKYYMKDEEFEIMDISINMFSGGPLIIENNGQNLLMGVIQISLNPIKKFNTDKGIYEFYTSEKGIAKSINKVLKLIDDWGANNYSPNPVELSLNNFHRAFVEYVKEDEMKFYPWDTVFSDD